MFQLTKWIADTIMAVVREFRRLNIYINLLDIKTTAASSEKKNIYIYIFVERERERESARAY